MWKNVKGTFSSLAGSLGAGAASQLQRKALAQSNTAAPASQSQGASLSGQSQSVPGIFDSLEGSLAAAFQKASLGVVANGQTALDAEIKKAEFDAVWMFGGAAAGALLYTANPLVGGAVGAALGLLSQSYM